MGWCDGIYYVVRSNGVYWYKGVYYVVLMDDVVIGVSVMVSIKLVGEYLL